MIPLNRAIARRLVPGFIMMRVSPNTITMLALLAGLLAGWYLAQGNSGAALYGAMLFLLSNVLDECDGTVARQTNRCSRMGAFLDTITDCIVHAAFFLGLGIGMARRFPHGPWLLLGGIAAGGAILSCLLDVGGVTPWEAPSESSGDRLAWIAEWFRVDFSLLVVISAALHRMSWLLWAGAIGVFLVWIPGTFVMAVKGRR